MSKINKLKEEKIACDPFSGQICRHLQQFDKPIINQISEH